jgi:hypothetical protein
VLSKPSILILSSYSYLILSSDHMMLSHNNMKAFILIEVTLLLACNAFSPSFNQRIARSQVATRQPSTILRESSENNDNEGKKASTKISLEEKMRGWEATEEEVKAASLGGIVPGRERTDAFDVGLYIAFPIMVVASLLVAFFPLIIGYIDVSSVGPPPTS